MNIFFSFEVKNESNAILYKNMQLGGLIITNGLYSGTVRDISHLINKENLLHPDKKVGLLGIASWYTVAENNLLLKSKVAIYIL